MRPGLIWALFTPVQSNAHHANKLLTFLFFFFFHPEYRACDRKPCLGRGNCTNIGNDFKCACEPYFTGRSCQTSNLLSCFSESDCSISVFLNAWIFISFLRSINQIKYHLDNNLLDPDLGRYDLAFRYKFWYWSVCTHSLVLCLKVYCLAKVFLLTNSLQENVNANNWFIFRHFQLEQWSTFFFCISQWTMALIIKFAPKNWKNISRYCHTSFQNDLLISALLLKNFQLNLYPLKFSTEFVLPCYEIPWYNYIIMCPFLKYWLIILLIFLCLACLSRWFQVMGIPRKGGQCLAVIYSNIVALNTKLFTRYLRRHPSKKINTKKLLEKLLRCLREP